MSWLSSIFGKGGNPANAAMPYFQQIPGVYKDYLNPYMEQGQKADEALNPQYESMMKDPAGFMNALMEAYQPSAGYQAREKQMLGQAANTAAAGGFSGTGTDVYNQAGIVNDLMSQDQQQYLQNALGILGTGMQGEQGYSNRGFQSADELANSIANALASQGGLAYQGKATQGARFGDLLKAYMGMMGSATGVARGSI